jgi:hypothetical protein
VGTYVMDENGEHIKKISSPPAREGYWPPESARMIAALPSGEYLLETVQHEKRTKAGPDRTRATVVRFNPGSGATQDVGFTDSDLYAGARVDYEASSSGRYLAAAKLPVSASATSMTVWVKDIQAGKERKLLTIPTKGMQGPFVGLVGWIDLER